MPFLVIASFNGAGLPFVVALVSRYNFVVAIKVVPFFAGILQVKRCTNVQQSSKMCKTGLFLKGVSSDGIRKNQIILFRYYLIFRGQRWIRTTEVVRQQIYSLPHLATLVFARPKQVVFKEKSDRFFRYLSDFCESGRRGSNPRPSAWKANSVRLKLFVNQIVIIYLHCLCRFFAGFLLFLH